jgi:NhaP-type Na+/H+ or K+/H+ antiporter
VLVLISAAFCLAVLFMMGRMKHHVKFFLIISVVILIYAVGKSIHLPSLLIVMIFGLFLANYHQLTELLARRFPSLKLLSSLEYKGMNDDLKQLHSLNAESAFLVRTFFFLVFGFSMHVSELLSWHTIIPGLIIAGMIFLVRAVYFRFFAKSHFWPEVVISPRGLISILLFLSIPADLQVIPGITGILVVAILCTSLVMTYGLVSERRGSDRNAA